MAGAKEVFEPESKMKNAGPKEILAGDVGQSIAKELNNSKLLNPTL